MKRAEYAALIVIDMQKDFCAAGGWVDQLGEGYERTSRPIPVIRRILQAARKSGLLVIHTREGHRPDLSDLNSNKQWRTRIHGLGIGDRGKEGRILVHGEPGWNIVDELKPLKNEVVIDKRGKSSFWKTPLDEILTQHGIRELYVAGVTTDCCVQSTIRDAFDRGYSCTVITDAVNAVEEENHLAHIRILTGGRVPFARGISGSEMIMEITE